MRAVIAACQCSGSAKRSDKDLKIALSEWLTTPPRRIDRLTLQALLCSVPLKSHIRKRCGLYLASKYPARSTMSSLLNSVCVQQRLPKPFEFVNSVSNAAGFHVAAQLGLQGPNLFIGAGPNVWQQLQALANLDLLDKKIDQALLILVDETQDFRAEAVLIGAATTATDFTDLTAETQPLQIRL